ncbi:MAG: TetR/AcrR family transcriptional regulator [Paracoccaceae bacterium]
MQSPTAPEQRSDDLLAAVRQVFAEKGFDGASMQDLARGAGISPGNFYRYFPSKAAIVEAMIARDMERLDRDFAEAEAAPHPLEAARTMFLAQITLTTTEDCSIWAEISATAMRKPEIAALAQKMHNRLLNRVIRFFAAASGLAESAAADHFRPQAELILLLVKGSNINRMLSGAAHPDVVPLLVGIVDRIIADIAQSSKAQSSKAQSSTKALPSTKAQSHA